MVGDSVILDVIRPEGIQTKRYLYPHFPNNSAKTFIIWPLFYKRFITRE